MNGFAVFSANRYYRYPSAYNQVVIRTLSGSANVAAEMIDSLGWPEIIGTHRRR